MSNFLSNQNINTLYNYVKNEILQKSNMNLDSDPKYRKVLSKLISTVYQKNKDKSVQYLNNLVLEKSIPFFINAHNKKNNKMRGEELNRKTFYQDNRPMQSVNNKESLSNLMMQRQLNTNNPFSDPLKEFDPVLSTRPQVRLADDKQEKLFPQTLNQLPNQPEKTLQNHINEIPALSKLQKIVSPPSNNNFTIDSNYDKNNINTMLQSLQVTGNPMESQNNNVNNNINNNVNNNISNNDLNSDKNFEDRLAKMQEDRSYNKLVNDHSKFENKIKQTEEAHKMIFNKIQQSKEDKKFLADIEKSRPEVDFNPQNFVMETKNPVDKTKQPDFSLNSKDFSQDNIIRKEDPEMTKLLENNWRSKDIKESSKQSLEELYQPAGYIDERSKGEMIIIDSDEFTTGADYDAVSRSNADVTFDAKLIDPVNIDKISDVYLEFLSLQNLKGPTLGTNPIHRSLERYHCFALEIDQFKMKTASNISSLSTKYIIPNESFGLNDVGAETVETNNTTSLNIKLKSNYMTTINPMKITNLKTTLYGYNHGKSLHVLQSKDRYGRVMMGLYVKKR